VALPSGPAGAVATPLFSLRGKMRVLAEPFIARGNVDDESLADLVRRRLGAEILTYAIEPFVAGIYAGDPEKLSARHAFPKLWSLEREHGSFVRGALRMRRTGPRPKMMSFRDGMGALPARLAVMLGEDLRCQARVESIAETAAGWSVAWIENGQSKRGEAATLVCAIPAFAVPQLPWSAEVRGSLGFLDRIEYPPVSIVALGFRRADVGHPLDGFGMLVPAAEKRQILGTIFSSSLFPGRAPEGEVLLTNFVGGARQPGLAALPDDELVRLVCEDLRALLGVKGEPVFRRIIRWPRAIPQYNRGYGEVLSALEKLEAAHPGLHFVGNYRGGIAAGQCIRNGLRLAEEMGARNQS
jgi:oxygen-dependent protoporphyrinogen oxidase